MITYVRVRTVKSGNFQGAIGFLRKYKEFIKSELNMDVSLGAEVGRLGTIVSTTRFENAQAWENALNKLRANAKYAELIDESATYFEDEVIEHLVTDVPI
jgi:hypothetical protein